MPTPTAKPSVYDPMKVAEPLVIDALNVGRLAMKRGDESELKAAVLEFVSQYGLLGFMTALPTTPEFLSYDAVYLPKNHFIREEVLQTQDYMSLFFPFRKPDIYKSKDWARWDVGSLDDDQMMPALAAAFSSEPAAVGLCVQRIYGERFDWLATQLRDLAFMLVSSFLFYDDKDELDELTRDLYRQGVSAFGGKAPTYHIALYDDKPQIVWDFHSLLLTVQTLFGFALTDEKRPIRICKQCNQAFIAERANSVFCSPACKNKHGVYKNRGKKEQDTD